MTGAARRLRSLAVVLVLCVVGAALGRAARTATAPEPRRAGRSAPTGTDKLLARAQQIARDDSSSVEDATEQVWRLLARRWHGGTVDLRVSGLDDVDDRELASLRVTAMADASRDRIAGKRVGRFRFAFENLRYPTRLRFVCETDGGLREEWSAAVTATPWSASRNVRPRHYFDVAITGADGRPVPDALVVAGVSAPEDTVRLTTDRRGVAAGACRGNVVSMRSFVGAWAEGHRPGVVQRPDEGTRRHAFALTLDPACTVAGSLPVSGEARSYDVAVWVRRPLDEATPVPAWLGRHLPYRTFTVREPDAAHEVTVASVRADGGPFAVTLPYFARRAYLVVAASDGTMVARSLTFEREGHRLRLGDVHVPWPAADPPRLYVLDSSGRPRAGVGVSWRPAGLPRWLHVTRHLGETNDSGALACPALVPGDRVAFDLQSHGRVLRETATTVVVGPEMRLSLE